MFSAVDKLSNIDHMDNSNNSNNNNNPSSSSRRADRKFIERDRRNQMKALYNNLNSLVPRHSSREAISLPDQLQEATNYIKKLQVKLEKLKDKKNTLLGIERANGGGSIMMNGRNVGSSSSGGSVVGVKSPQIEIQQVGLALEVVLITGLDFQFMFNEAIRVLHEEGADVVNATYKVVEDAVFHTIHCQVVESANGTAARISERLKKFVYDSSNIYI